MAPERCRAGTEDGEALNTACGDEIRVALDVDAGGRAGRS